MRRPPVLFALAVLGVCALTAYAYAMVRLNSSTTEPRPPVEPPSAPRGALDEPADGTAVLGAIEVRGWAIDVLAAGRDTGVDRVQVYLDGQLSADATYGTDRNDIAGVIGPRFGPSGWAAQIDLTGQPLGDHRLEARARSTVTGQEAIYERTVQVVAAPSMPRGWIDLPAEGAPVAAGELEVRGWALDAAAAQGTGVDRVELFVDGVLASHARYGQLRADLASAYGQQFGASGWAATIDLARFPTGPHLLEARAMSTYSSQPTSYRATIAVER